MPLELEEQQPDLPATVRSANDARDSGDAGTTQRTAEVDRNPFRIPNHSVTLEAPVFCPHPLTRHFPRDLAPPLGGELHLWRFRCEWLPVPVQESETWLSKTERDRARMHPNIALRKRFVSARAVVRWIVGHLFACEPHDVDLQDDGGDRLHARDPRDGRRIGIEVAYGGIWIVIGIASTTLGLSVVVPSPGAALDQTADALRGRARYNSLRNALRDIAPDISPTLLAADTGSDTFDFAEHGSWHLLDLPMGGKICVAVALARPLTLVHTFGWRKDARFG